MLKLISLELKKTKLNWYLKGTIIANIAILGFIWLLAHTEELESGAVAFADYSEAFMAIGTFVRVTFIIFAAVLISKLIIVEFNQKTISVLFTYPISRKKLMFAKMIIISAITFLTIAISNIIVSAGFLALNRYFHYISESVSADFIVKQVISMLVYAVAAAGMALIPIYFGMLKESVPATIVSAIVIAAIFNSNNQGFSLGSIIAIPLTTAAIGILIAYLAVRKVDRIDIV